MTDPQPQPQPVEGHADELPDDDSAYVDPGEFPNADDEG